MYRASYTAAKSDDQYCLGTYAFLWGNKLEATSTWFGMLLEEDGSRTAAVDTMTELWTGKPPQNKCPEIKSLTLKTHNEVKPATRLEFELSASDPEGDNLSVTWSVRPEVNTYITYGEPQPNLPRLDNLIIESTKKKATIRTPRKTRALPHVLFCPRQPLRRSRQQHFIPSAGRRQFKFGTRPREITGRPSPQRQERYRCCLVQVALYCSVPKRRFFEKKLTHQRYTELKRALDV